MGTEELRQAFHQEPFRQALKEAAGIYPESDKASYHDSLLVHYHLHHQPFFR